jgi:phosphatidylinositol alpha-1,6-mannosyltransferase
VSRGSDVTREMPASIASSQAKRVILLFPELLGTGGIQEVGRQTARALDAIAQARGWQLQIFSLNDVQGQHDLLSVGRPVRFRAFGRRKIRFVISVICQVLSPRGDKLRLVLAGHPNLALPASGIKGLSRSVKTIVMAHGVEVWNQLPLLRRIALLHADLVLAPSENTMEKLVEVQRIPTKKIRKLAWPMDPSFLRMADAPASLRLPPAFPPGRVILTVGRWSALERYKGLDDLIQATAKLRDTFTDLHLVVVGGGDDLPRLRKLATNAGVADYVDFLERLPQEELAACYANAEVFALPSTGEGFGLVFLEAMAFAQPIVAAACGGTIDVVVDGVNGLLVSAHDSPGLVNALGRLLRDDSLRATLGRNGAEMVRRKYRFEAFEGELADILSELSPLQGSRADL